MARENNCRCPRCTIRGLMGPAVLITIGVLFLLNQLHTDTFNFSNTWPFILIVIGTVLLGSAMAPMTGHVDSTISPLPPAPPAAPSAPPNIVPGQGQ